VNTTLDDQALLSILAAPGPFTGSFKPEGLLADFHGENPNGTWKLRVTDDAGNDVGALKSWSLAITSHETNVVTDESGNYAFFDLLPGSYAVRDVARPNWESTYPAAPGLYALTVGLGEQAGDNNFGAQATAIFGDYDGDDDADGHDFLTWQRRLGQAASPSGSGADGDGSGQVDAGDLGVWRSAFGSSLAPALANATAPAEGSGHARAAALAELDAASLMGPLAYRQTAPGAVRQAFRPAARGTALPSTFATAGPLRAATIAAALTAEYGADAGDDGEAPSTPANGEDDGNAAAAVGGELAPALG
jgi:hypothetical protein